MGWKMRRQKQAILLFLIFTSIANGATKATGDSKENNDSNENNNNNNSDDDDTSRKIEEEGKSIDRMSSLIEHSTDNMEDEIEKAGKAIDSPDAEKRIMIAGKGVDDLADEMDEKTEKEGQLIENAMQTVTAKATMNNEVEDTKSVETGDKHEKVEQVEKATKISQFDEQEKLRQKMEDLLEFQGKKVEDIGNKMEKSRRSHIQRSRRQKSNTKSHKAKAKGQKSKLKDILRRKMKNAPEKFRKTKTKYVNKNATKRRVIIPVNRKKLEKLMLYYYVKDKMKNGELNAHNLAKFFDNIEDLPLANSKARETGSRLQTFDKNSKDDEEIEKSSEEKTKSNFHDTADLKSMLNKFLNLDEEKKEIADDKKEFKSLATEDLKDMLQTFMKSNDETHKSESEDDDKYSELKTMIKSLENKGETREKKPALTANDDTPDIESLKESISKQLSDSQGKDGAESVLTTDQVHKMLDKIKLINATIFQMEKKKKEKSSKKCIGTNCFGRALISLLDSALHAVNQDKTEKPPHSSNHLVAHESVKVTGEARSKSDPYAGIGFAENQEKTGEADGESTGTERHLSSHGVDIIGTSHPVGVLSERAHLRYSHHEDDGDDDDDDDDDDEDDLHHRHMAHGSYFPLPMPQSMHHVHHHVHHLVHDDEGHHDGGHHGYFGGGHHGYYGGFRGHHGHIMPIRTNYHHDEHGYVEPLNVDTAPMPHYPDRHIHDHVDVDTLLRGHPFNYHHHTPDIALEGPISTASVYEDMHHMLNGPGIHDQPDVHYEVEMHAHPYHHEAHHEDDHHDDDHHEDDHNGDDEGDHGDHHDDDYHHDDEYHEDHHGDDHHEDDHNGDDEGDHGDHHDDDYHHDDEYHEDHHGDDHQYSMHGDKKHVIEKAKNKMQRKMKDTKQANTSAKMEGIKKQSKKPKRHRRHEDEDDEDDDDVEEEKVPRNGHGVARLSYLTQHNGEEMEHEINEGILDVEDVGRSIEEKVQRGVDRVTEISNHDVEAPDYDSEGHMEPTIHREDIEEDDDR